MALACAVWCIERSLWLVLLTFSVPAHPPWPRFLQFMRA